MRKQCIVFNYGSLQKIPGITSFFLHNGITNSNVSRHTKHVGGSHTDTGPTKPYSIVIYTKTIARNKPSYASPFNRLRKNVSTTAYHTSIARNMFFRDCAALFHTRNACDQYSPRRWDVCVCVVCR